MGRGGEAVFRGAARPRISVRVPGFRVNALDTTGAGDAFTAGLVYGKAAGLETEKTIALAVRLAQHTLSQPGAVVPLGSKDEFLGGIR